VAVVLLASTAAFALSASGQNGVPFLQAQPGSLRWDTGHRLNVLLLGTSGGGAHAQTSAMIIASYDPRSETATFLSIPPNLWVTIPGYGPGPIEQAFSDGGPRLALLVTESVVDVAVPYYAVASGNTFGGILDAFGGVTLPVGRLQQGSKRPQHLAGAAAIAYSSPQGAPLGRQMRRQRDVLLALRQRTSQPDILLRVPTVLNTLGGSVSTNFPYNQVPYLAKLLAQLPASHVRSAGLDPESGAVMTYQNSGTIVSVADWQRIRTLAQSLLPEPALASDAALQVVNASGLPGRATVLSGWLRQVGLRAAPNVAAVSLSYPRTEVMVRRGAGAAELDTAAAAAALVQAPIVTGSVPKGGAQVALIIGHDFQDLTQP
jgi:hypothetical protein